MKARNLRRRIRESPRHAKDALLRRGLLGRRPRLYHWQSRNFGDALSPAVIRLVTGIAPVRVTADYAPKLLAVGSILQGGLREGDVVWGSGLIRDVTLETSADTRFLAVRGPLTRERIHGTDVPEVYGDPAQLLPLFYDDPVDRQHRIGIVPHYVDDAKVRCTAPSGLLVIDVLRPWREVVDAIRSCEVVISSSLHGVIVAEAYGIPAVWMEVSDKVIGKGFKFRDYLLATGRDPIEPATWPQVLDRIEDHVLPEPRWDPEPLLTAAARILPSLGIPPQR